MIDNYFRKRLPDYVGILIRAYKKLGLHPNHVTVLGLAFGIASAFMVSKQMFIGAAAVWWLGRLLDGTDGIYARATGQTSEFGSYLDIVADMTAYSAMIVGFSFAFPQFNILWIIILFLYVLCITGALALGNLQEKMQVPGKDNRGLRLAVGLAEGGETGIAYTVFLIAPGWIHISAMVWVAILVITVLARFILALKELK